MAASNSTIMNLWSPTARQIKEALACTSCGVIPMLPIQVCDAQGHPYCFWCAHKASFKCTKVSEGLDVPCGGGIHPHRCRLAEAIFLQSMFQCNYAANGCTAVVSGQEFVAHQDICSFRTYECPCELKCLYPIVRRDFIPHFLVTHEIPMITINSHELVEHKIIFPTRSVEENNVMWVERIMKVHHECKTLYLFMNCKYEFNESKLIIWISEFEDVRDMKIRLTMSFINSTGKAVKRMNGMTYPYFCKFGKLLKDRQAFTVKNATMLVGGTENTMNFWKINLRFIFHSLSCNFVPIPSE